MQVVCTSSLPGPSGSCTGCPRLCVPAGAVEKSNTEQKTAGKPVKDTSDFVGIVLSLSVRQAVDQVVHADLIRFVRGDYPTLLRVSGAIVRASAESPIRTVSRFSRVSGLFALITHQMAVLWYVFFFRPALERLHAGATHAKAPSQLGDPPDVHRAPDAAGPARRESDRIARVVDSLSHAVDPPEASASSTDWGQVMLGVPEEFWNPTQNSPVF